MTPGRRLRPRLLRLVPRRCARQAAPRGHDRPVATGVRHEEGRPGRRTHPGPALRPHPGELRLPGQGAGPARLRRRHPRRQQQGASGLGRRARPPCPADQSRQAPPRPAAPPRHRRQPGPVVGQGSDRAPRHRPRRPRRSQLRRGVGDRGGSRRRHPGDEGGRLDRTVGPRAPEAGRHDAPDPRGARPVRRADPARRQPQGGQAVRVKVFGTFRPLRKCGKRCWSRCCWEAG